MRIWMQTVWRHKLKLQSVMDMWRYSHEQDIIIRSKYLRGRSPVAMKAIKMMEESVRCSRVPGLSCATQTILNAVTRLTHVNGKNRCNIFISTTDDTLSQSFLLSDRSHRWTTIVLLNICEEPKIYVGFMQLPINYFISVNWQSLPNGQIRGDEQSEWLQSLGLFLGFVRKSILQKWHKITINDVEFITKEK